MLLNSVVLKTDCDREGRGFASSAFERDSRSVAFLMHGFSKFVNLASVEVYILSANPANTNKSARGQGVHFDLLRVRSDLQNRGGF